MLPGTVHRNTETRKKLRDLPYLRRKKVCVVSQTTFNYNKFKDLVEILAKKGYDILMF